MPKLNENLRNACNDANRALGAAGGAILYLEMEGRTEQAEQVRQGYDLIQKVYRELELEEDPDLDYKLAAVITGRTVEDLKADPKIREKLN